jgi:hypothetical protein
LTGARGAILILSLFLFLFLVLVPTGRGCVGGIDKTSLRSSRDRDFLGALGALGRLNWIDWAYRTCAHLEPPPLDDRPAGRGPSLQVGRGSRKYQSLVHMYASRAASSRDRWSEIALLMGTCPAGRSLRRLGRPVGTRRDNRTMSMDDRGASSDPSMAQTGLPANAAKSRHRSMPSYSSSTGAQLER